MYLLNYLAGARERGQVIFSENQYWIAQCNFICGRVGAALFNNAYHIYTQFRAA